MNFFQDVISQLQLSHESQRGAGVLWLICSVAVATGATGTYTGNPFAALRNAIVSASNGARPTEFRGDAESVLAAAENRWAISH